MIPPLAAARLQRWAVLLSAYSYEVEFWRNDRHTNSDSLSRLPLKNQDSNDTVDEATVFSLCQIECLPVTALEIKRDSKTNPRFSVILRLGGLSE